MINRFTFSWVMTLIGLTTTIGYAQQSSLDPYWLGVGVGKTQLPTAMIALGYEFVNKPTLLMARYTDSREFLPDHSPSVVAQEIALLYGVRAGKFRFSTGISNVWGRNRGRYLYTDPDPIISGSFIHESVRYSTVGLPAEIRFITAVKSIGVGLTAFGNLNAKRSFVGLTGSLYVGNVK